MLLNEKDILIKIIKFYKEFNIIDNYITFFDIDVIKEKYLFLYKQINCNLFFKIKYIKFIYDYINISKLKKLQNQKYIYNEMQSSKYLLDNINGHSLDYEQRVSVITDENNNLIIAGAGSGKTLTIIGKIRYLIERKNIKPAEILCISFTNDSVNDIKKSLLKYYNYNIDVYTFHKLALNILKKQSREPIKIVDDNFLDYVIDEYIRCNFNDNIILNKENYDIHVKIKILISTFINLFKSNNYNISKFDEFEKINLKYNNKHVQRKNNILLMLIRNIYLIYEEELKSQNMIDFNDMINIASTKIDSNINYKYIIIDEYQDTSITRYKFIKSIKDRCHGKIMAVGDDFQSIYRFTGCNISIFLNFEKYFGKSSILKLENTYRNSKELIDVADKFIMKNRYQMAKNLKSNKCLNKPIKIIYYEDLIETFEKLINIIDTDIFVLARNNRDINPILKSDKFDYIDNKIIYSDDKIKDISFFTIHRSKGLEASNIIILNMVDDYLGLPNKIVNDSILDFVVNDKDSYPYEEERRLFYVALTRTKNNVYILTKKNKESIFVKEIINNSRKNIQILNELI